MQDLQPVLQDRQPIIEELHSSPPILLSIGEMPTTLAAAEDFETTDMEIGDRFNAFNYQKFGF